MTPNKPSVTEYKSGRIFIGRLPHGKDLIPAIEATANEFSIQMAVFTVIGAVSSVTFGAYDQNQQVYVTLKEEKPLEIVTCTGNVSLKEGKPFVHAHIMLADEQGKTLGGHLFSETIIYAGELYLRELIGNPLDRTYDPTTGLMLWRE